MGRGLEWAAAIEIAPFNRECSYLVWTIFFLSTESHTAGGQPSTRHLSMGNHTTVLSDPGDVSRSLGPSWWDDGLCARLRDFLQVT